MLISIQDYIDACTLELYDYLNLATIDFSAAPPAAITQFCSWLQNYRSVTHVSFVDSIRGGHIGVFLGRLRPEYLVQIFNAIRENQRIQHIELLNCHLEEITDVSANVAIGNCLASKTTVRITGNKNTPRRSGPSPEILMRLANGIVTDLRMDFIKWRSSEIEEAFFAALTAKKDSVFQRIALVNNTVDLCCLAEHLHKLFTMQVTVLDLSHNRGILSGLTVEEWLDIITTIKANRSLRELSLEATDMRPYKSDEIPLRQALQTMILELINSTHLTKLDISTNLWDDEFIAQLRHAVATRSPVLPKLKLFYSLEGVEEYEDEEREKSALTAAATAGAVQTIATPGSVSSPVLRLSRDPAVEYRLGSEHTQMIQSPNRTVPSVA